MCHPLSVPARVSMRVGRVEYRIDSPFDCDQIELWIVVVWWVLVFLWIFFCVLRKLGYCEDRIDLGTDWGFAYRIYNIYKVLNINLDGSLTSPLHSAFLCYTPPILKVHPISVTSLTPLHLSLFPLFHPSFPVFTVSLISVPISPWSSRLSHSLLTPFLSFLVSH